MHEIWNSNRADALLGSSVDLENLLMKILVVEHESLLALALEEQLRAAGHDVLGPVRAYDEALTFARMQRPTLAIVDIDISNAEERARLVCTLNGLFGIPSIVLANRQREVTQCEGVTVAILEKPSSIERILSAVDFAAAATVEEAADSRGSSNGITALGHSKLESRRVKLAGGR
nr:hypothetical protein [Gammaproteobacteria bacterium]